MILQLLTKTDFHASLDKKRGLEVGPITIINGLRRQRISRICRHNSYQIGLADFLVLVDNIKFPNFKEEINV